MPNFRAEFHKAIQEVLTPLDDQVRALLGSTSLQVWDESSYGRAFWLASHRVYDVGNAIDPVALSLTFAETRYRTSAAECVIISADITGENSGDIIVEAVEFRTGVWPDDMLKTAIQASEHLRQFPKEIARALTDKTRKA